METCLASIKYKRIAYCDYYETCITFICLVSLLQGIRKEYPDQNIYDSSLSISIISNLNFVMYNRYQIYATVMSFYGPLSVMVVVYVKILRVVADKKKEMSWKHRPSSKLQHHANSVLVVKNSSGSTSNNSSSNKSLSHKRHLKAVDVRFNKSHNGGPLLPLQPTNTSQSAVVVQSSQMPNSNSLSPGAGFNNATSTTTSSTLHRLKKGQLPLLRSKYLFQNFLKTHF